MREGHEGTQVIDQTLANPMITDGLILTDDYATASNHKVLE